MPPPLWIAFFEDFKGADTVLVSGTDQGIRELAGHLRQFAASAENELAIHKIAAVAPYNPVELFAVHSSQPIKRSRPCFEWICPPPDGEPIVSTLLALAGRGAAHQYFELPDPDTQLIVSVGEYDRHAS
jgi:hypothetical protein